MNLEKAIEDNKPRINTDDQEDYRCVKPTSEESCDKLLVERLADRLR